MNNERCLVVIVLFYYILSAISFVGELELSATVKVADPESMFASGRRANIESVDGAALSLIPGISDKLSSSILNYRTKKGLPRPLKLTDWNKISGIGNKKSAVLEKYIY